MPKKDPFETKVLPGATFIGIPHSSGEHIAWDGEQYVFRASKDSILSEGLRYIGSVQELSVAEDTPPLLGRVSVVMSKTIDPNDPKDWSPLRRYVEAHQMLEELRAKGPRLTIPESGVRRTLAAQFGCTPEEISFDQISFAVSELLPIYPLISVVPTEFATPKIPPGDKRFSSGSKVQNGTFKSPSRKAFVDPILAEKGWSVLEWADAAKVAHATAMDYLQDKTSPYPSTRLKLAKALGIPVEDLPA